VALGKERVQRDFFPKYLAKISEGQKNHGILIDSTGMQNDIQSPLTAINNHNGVGMTYMPMWQSTISGALTKCTPS